MNKYNETATELNQTSVAAWDVTEEHEQPQQVVHGSEAVRSEDSEWDRLGVNGEEITNESCRSKSTASPLFLRLLDSNLDVNVFVESN